MIVQALLVVIGLLFLVKALSSRRTYYINAWKKIGIILLSILMIVAVIFPNLTTELANILGIGRGADLLLYTLFAAFIFTVLNQYLKDQDQRDVIYRLARRVAVLEAKEKYHLL